MLLMQVWRRRKSFRGRDEIVGWSRRATCCQVEVDTTRFDKSSLSDFEFLTTTSNSFHLSTIPPSQGLLRSHSTQPRTLESLLYLFTYLLTYLSSQEFLRISFHPAKNSWDFIPPYQVLLRSHSIQPRTPEILSQPAKNFWDLTLSSQELLRFHPTQPRTVEISLYQAKNSWDFIPPSQGLSTCIILYELTLIETCSSNLPNSTGSFSPIKTRWDPAQRVFTAPGRG